MLKFSRCTRMLLALPVFMLDNCWSTAPGKIYWADKGIGCIQRANLDGSDVEDVVVNLGQPEGLALDVANNKLYWTDAQHNRVQRADLDYFNVEVVDSQQGPSQYTGIAIHNGEVYWTDLSGQVVWRKNVDNSGLSNRESILTPEARLQSVFGVVVDPQAEKIYWTDTYGHKIQRANLDGSEIQDVMVGCYVSPCSGVEVDDLRDPTGITLDPVNRQLFYADSLTDVVRSLRIDSWFQEFGLGFQTVSVGQVQSPQFIAVDPRTQKVYFTDAQTQSIQSASYDGTSWHHLIVGLHTPSGIVVHPLPPSTTTQTTMISTSMSIDFSSTVYVDRISLNGNALSEEEDEFWISNAICSHRPLPACMSALAFAVFFTLYSELREFKLSSIS